MGSRIAPLEDPAPDNFSNVNHMVPRGHLVGNFAFYADRFDALPVGGAPGHRPGRQKRREEKPGRPPPEYRAPARFGIHPLELYHTPPR